MTTYTVFKEIFNEEEWSDWKCYTIAFRDQFPDIVKDIGVQKNIINTYFNFYLSGKVPKGMSVTDVIFATIAIMPKCWDDEEFIWDKRLEWYSNNGTLFFISSEHKVSTEINRIKDKISNTHIECENNSSNITNNDSMPSYIDGDSSIHENENKPTTCSPATTEMKSEDENQSTTRNDETKSDNLKESDISNSNKTPKIIWVSKKYGLTQKKNECVTQYTPEDNAKFCAFVNNILKIWDVQKSSRTCLKYYFGLTGLMLMRTITKSYMKVKNAFESVSYRNIENMIFNNHSVPDKKCIKKSFKAFRSADKNLQIMFAKLVINSRLVDVTTSKYYIKNIFKLGLLLHTAYFKMDLIKMIEEVVCHIDFEKLMNILNIDELADSRQKIYNFIKKYMTYYDGNILHTCHWAPIIEKHQFQELTCSSNIGFAVVIAVFKEKLYMNSDIWKAMWVKDIDTAKLQAYKQLGAELYEQYNKKYNILQLFFSTELLEDLDF